MSLSSRLVMIPDWQALILILLVMVSLSLVGFFIVHRLIPVEVRRIHNDVAGFIFAAIGVNYGVLLAFVVVMAWEQFDDTRSNTVKETSAAVSLFHAMGAYAAAAHGDDLRPALEGYLTMIVEREFPAMAAMHPPNVNSWGLQALWAGVRALSPSSAREQVLDSELIARLNELDRLRFSRLTDAHEELPSVIWLALIAGAIITIGFSFLFGTEHVRTHAMMISLLSALTGVVFYVAIELDHPFTGTVSIGDEGFRQVLEMMARH